MRYFRRQRCKNCLLQSSLKIYSFHFLAQMCVCVCVFLIICYYQIHLIYARLIVFSLIFCKGASILWGPQFGESHTLTDSDAKWFCFRDESSFFFILQSSRETRAHFLKTKAPIMWNDRSVTECHYWMIFPAAGYKEAWHLTLTPSLRN